MTSQASKKLQSLREKLIEETVFLKNIESSKPLKVRHMLNAASSKQLKLLIKIIHHVVSGNIPLKGADFSLLTRARKISLLSREFEREKDVSALLKKSRGDILSVLYKVQSVIGVLLSPIVKK
jgi:hypothetical protein